MANNSNHGNQPRRKRNKKPVKRYSEEYSNRPNPYTGYSADGNYHPGAKKRSIEEESTPLRASHSTFDSGDYSRAAMTDAVLPPASANRGGYGVRSGIQPQGNTQPAPASGGSQEPVSRNYTEKAMPRPSVPMQEESSGSAAAADDDIVRLAETASHLENQKKDNPSQVTSHSTGSSHRKKNNSHRQTEEIRKAKTEARKATVAQLAKDVAAEEWAATAAAAEKAAQASQKTKESGINWDEYYDAAFPPKPEGSEKNASTETSSKSRPAPSGNKPKEKKARRFEEVSEQSAPMTVTPVELNENEALPYDRIMEENIREAQEASPSSQPLTQEETAQTVSNVPDFTPVLDFASSEPTVFPDQPENTPADEEPQDIGQIFDEARQQVEITASPDTDIPSHAGEETAEPASDVPFTDTPSDDWHEVQPPPADDSAENATENLSDAVATENSASLLSRRLMESYMAIEDEPLITFPEDNPEQTNDSDEFTETVDLNQFFNTPDSVAVEVEPASHDSLDGEVEVAALAEEIFGAADISDSQPLLTGQKDAVSAETADIADALRQQEESPDAETSPEKLPEEVDIFSMAPPLPLQETIDVETAAQSEEPMDGEISEEDEDASEEVRQYQPRQKRSKDENVFESVLIVDDSHSVVDDAAAGKQDDMQFLHSAAVTNPTAVFKLPEGSLMLPPDIDDADFQEEWLGDEEDGDEMAKRSKKARRRISAFIGGVAILFAVMILVSALSTVITGFHNIGGANEKKTEYSQFIEPVVLNDPAPFESLEKADNQMLLESAIWRVLGQMSQAEDQEQAYTQDATGKIVVPAERVAQAGRELFGNNVEIKMDVLIESDGSAIYYYDSIENTFHISIGGIVGPSAVITKMAQKSDYVSLVVGYVLQDEMTLTSSNVDCYKYMEYILAYNDDGSYYIQSIRNYVED